MSERLTDAEIDAMERNIQPYDMHRYNDEGVPVHTLAVRRCLPADQALSLIDDLRATRAELAELRGVVREAVAAMRKFTDHNLLTGITARGNREPSWLSDDGPQLAAYRALVAMAEVPS